MTLVEVTAACGNVGPFVSAIAVLATSVYLTTQIHDANRASALAAVQANRAERRAWFLANRDSPFLADIEVRIENGELLDAPRAS